MLEKITDHARFVVQKAEDFYENALEKTGPAKEKALEITTNTIKNFYHKQSELKKYTNEISESAGFKIIELKKSMDFSQVIPRLMDNMRRNYGQAKVNLANIQNLFQKISEKTLKF